MEVLPAIDLFRGEVVRLKQGRYDDVTVYDASPSDRARTFAAHATRLHVVDLEGARAGRCVQRAVIEEIVRAFGAGVQVGGGIRDDDAVESYFACGVERVVLGTAAVRDPEFVRRAATRYPGRVVVALDAREGMVATDGWESVSERTAVDVARSMKDWPLAAVLYTDVVRDGTEVGPAVEATAELARESGLAVLASGGVGSLDHLRALAVYPEIEGVVVGRALYEGRFDLAQAIEAAESPSPY